MRTINPEVSLAVQTLTSATHVWTNLYARDFMTRAVTLMGQLFSLDFPRGSTMHPFLMRAKVIHDQLLLMGVALSSLQLAALIIIKLPLDYDMVSRHTSSSQDEAGRL